MADYVADPNVYWDAGTQRFGIAAGFPSSKRYKENIKPLVAGFNQILQIEPKTFTYKDSGKQDIGFIAEDFDDLGLKELVKYDEKGRPDSLKYDRVSLYLLEVIKQQQKRIEALEAKVGK